MDNNESHDVEFEIINHLDNSYKRDVKAEIREGLTGRQKNINCKYFYDSRGSQLFEEICTLPEYYLTRLELSILQSRASDMVKFFDAGDLLELGSGSCKKIQILLDGLGGKRRGKSTYLPVDISESAVIDSSRQLTNLYPELKITAIVADITRQMDIITTDRPSALLFLGSTIGNFSASERLEFLKGVAKSMKPHDRLILAFDMVKDIDLLHAAYNDTKGVTAEFNKNALLVVNREADGDFDPANFEHIAFFNEGHCRIEMHLKALKPCLVKLKSLDVEISFDQGETIHTENSHKFTTLGIERLVGEAGLNIEQIYTDEDNWFSILELSAV
ncbi:MAG: L-histidine N(alpha)-methyltransferase [Candidatus Magnetominusculus sp. LBB02]|nr:L-histidine N(alpha)-methyltransferase [Candidatus Magnetominusculus sp. LBB02]